jgi:hypothetical protein
VYLACATIYTLVAGPYLEVPADALWHIGQIRKQAMLLQIDAAFSLPLHKGGL